MKRLCDIHGLWSKTTTVTRCPQCKTQTAKSYDKTSRDKDLDKFYHSINWKRARIRQLRANPLCVECHRPAQIVDHIIELRYGGAKLSSSNLQSMCKPCHNIKTVQERIKRGGAVKSLPNDDRYTEPPAEKTQKLFSGGGV